MTFFNTILTDVFGSCEPLKICVLINAQKQLFVLSLTLTLLLSPLSFRSPTQAYSSILVVMVILLNIGMAILFIHFFI